MRRITLKMPKRIMPSAFVFCIDPEGNETVNGHLCKRVCALGGGERTFDLSNDICGFFAVVEQDYSKRVIGELIFEPDWRDKAFCIRPSRSGKGVEISEVVQRESKISGRAKAMIIKWTMISLLAFFVFGGIIGIIFRPYSKMPKKLTVNEFTITLTNAFERDYYARDPIYAAFGTETCYVVVEKVSFSETYEYKYYDEVEFCELLIEINGINASKIEQKDSMTWFTYSRKNDDKTFEIYLYVYKTDEAYWVVQFYAEDRHVDYWDGLYHRWARSVRFN